MKRSVLRFALPVIALLCVPSIFNSCQGGLLGGAFNSSKSCKIGLEKGIVTKLEIDETLPPAPFANRKVRLRDADSSAGAQAKATAPLQLAEGTNLGVIVDNSCLQKGGLENTVISKAAADSGELLAQLDRQAYQWKLDRAYSDGEIEEIANQDPCVVGVSWNREYQLQSMTFNDLNFANQTHFAALRAPESYDLFYAAGALGMAGNAVQIAVIDTGVDWNHPDIKGNMWVHSQGVGIDITTLGTSLVDYNPFDVSDIGHGTHVSGLIGAIANNSQGTVGLMPYRAKIMGIKVFQRDNAGDLSTTSQYFYNALKFAYLNGANVANLSLGSVTSGAATDAVAEAGVDEAVQHGVVVVTVIGNADSGNGVNINGTTMSSIPGQFSTKAGVLGVGAFDSATGNKSYFSHYSTTYAEIGAPGAEQGNTGIYSTLPTSMGSYGRLAGTSQAAPLVSAAAGLTVALIKEKYNVPPTPAEVERLILSSARKTTELSTYFKDGNRLDLMNLVQKINADYPLTRGGAPVNLAASGCQ